MVTQLKFAVFLVDETVALKGRKLVIYATGVEFDDLLAMKVGETIKANGHTIQRLEPMSSDEFEAYAKTWAAKEQLTPSQLNARHTIQVEAVVEEARRQSS